MHRNHLYNKEISKFCLCRDIAGKLLSALKFCDAENSYQSLDVLEDDPMLQIHGHSVTYLTAVVAQQGRKVFTLQTIASQTEQPVDSGRDAKRLRIFNTKHNQSSSRTII